MKQSALRKAETGQRGEDRVFAAVVKALAKKPGVSCGAKKGFGSGALKVKGKIFAMMSSAGDFVVKLPRERVEKLVAGGEGEKFEPRPGRFMAEWLVIHAPAKQWPQLAREGYEFVKRGK